MIYGVEEEFGDYALRVIALSLAQSMSLDPAVPVTLTQAINFSMGQALRPPVPTTYTRAINVQTPSLIRRPAPLAKNITVQSAQKVARPVPVRKAITIQSAQRVRPPQPAGNIAVLQSQAVALASPYFAFASRAAAAGAPLSGSDAVNYHNLLDGLVADGLMNADGTSNYLDALYVLAAPSSTVALLNLVSGSYNLTANGSPTFVAYQGYTGGTNSKFLNTGFVPSTAGGKFTQNSAHLSVWNNTAVAVQNGEAIGALTSGSGASHIFPRFTDNKAYYRINDGSTNSAGATVTDGIGFYLASRSGSSAQAGYKNATDQGITAVSSLGLTSTNIYILTSNTNGTAVGAFSGQISAASIGGSLNSTQVTALYNRLATYRTAVGL